MEGILQIWQSDSPVSCFSIMENNCLSVSSWKLTVCTKTCFSLDMLTGVCKPIRQKYTTINMKLPHPAHIHGNTHTLIRT